MAAAGFEAGEAATGTWIERGLATASSTPRPHHHDLFPRSTSGKQQQPGKTQGKAQKPAAIGVAITRTYAREAKRRRAGHRTLTISTCPLAPSQTKTSGSKRRLVAARGQPSTLTMKRRRLLQVRTPRERPRRAQHRILTRLPPSLHLRRPSAAAGPGRVAQDHSRRHRR